MVLFEREFVMENKEKNNTFSENLKRIMKEKNKRQIDISNDLNIPKTTVNSWVKGRSVPLLKTLVELAEYFRVSVDEFTVPNRKEK